ncbi:hypothetical protein BDV41DRAFT_547140 [Aspergillus transmontanensis]|uniref:Uncharacterized protein n=1 Tax=Aspergillus transmontanensis TaxID=1034304 RepID=A0A5N6VNJ0_9EURO|nr:hypothetical protein BDV41DRAFT_547140 [Aspergillus transmontanensis]
MRNKAIGHYCPALTYCHGHHGQAGAYKDSRKAKSTYLGRCIERRGMTFGFYTLLLVREDHTYAMKVLDGVRLSLRRKRSSTRCMEHVVGNSASPMHVTSGHSLCFAPRRPAGLDDTAEI